MANFIALGVTLMSLAVASVILRFWLHTKSKVRFGPDDALIIPAVVSEYVHHPSCGRLIYCRYVSLAWRPR